jgi:hypothetical protein
MCDSGYNSAFTAAGSWDGLIACGPGGTHRLENQAGSPLPGDWEWECPELSKRWLYQEFGLPEQAGNGYQTVSAYWNYIQSHPAGGYPLTLVTPSTASAGSLGPGDVVSYANVNGDDGHTNVVTSTTPAPFTGTGSITTLNENTGGFITINVTNWHFGLDDFSGNYMAATGWLHYAGSSPAPQHIVIRSGSTLLAKNGVTGSWVTEAGGLTSSTKILAFGDMIGYIENNASGVPVLWAKQGLNGTWYVEYGPVNAAVFTG